MPIRPRLPALLLVGLFAQGCASIATFQTPRPIGKGVSQFALEASGLGVQGDAGALTIPSISLRYGVSDQIEVGGRFGLSGIELLGKFVLLDGKDGLALALAPTVAGIGGFGLGFFTFSVPLLVGIPLGEDHELVLGPRIYDMYTFAGLGDESVGVNGLAAGASLALSLGVSKDFRLIPEFAAVKPLLGSVRIGDLGESGSTNDLGWIYQFGVAFVFGR